VTTEEKKAEQEERAIAEREEAVLKVLSRALEPLTTNNLAELIPGRASVTRRAVTRLVHAGRVVAEKGPRQSALHRLPDVEEEK
jgi:predicted transcriptional regulator